MGSSYSCCCRTSNSPGIYQAFGATFKLAESSAENKVNPERF
jgi:hypothetical protein